MALAITDNFNYQGKLPNFVRDQFTTVAAMKAYPATSLDEGHVSYCVETGRRYQWKNSNSVLSTTGKWRILSDLQLLTTLGDSVDQGITQKAITVAMYKRPAFTEVAAYENPAQSGVVSAYGESTFLAISQAFFTESMEGGFYVR